MKTPMRFLIAGMFAFGWAVGHYPATAELDEVEEIAAETRGYLAGLTDGAREASIKALSRRCTWQQWLAVDK